MRLWSILLAFIGISAALPSSSNPQQHRFNLEGGDDYQLAESYIQSGAKEANFRGKITCGSCRHIVKNLRKILLRNHSKPWILYASIKICVSILNQPIETCENVIPTFSPWLVKVMSHPDFNVDSLCAAVDYCPIDPRWKLKFPKPKPTEPRRRRSEGSGKQHHIIHLSDWHYDEQYREGYDAVCADPICCRTPPNGEQSVQRPAGLFGDFHCDSPKQLASAVLAKAMSLKPDVKFVIMTGDLPPHDVWSATDESVIEAEEVVARQLRENFKNTQVLMTIGNHENSQSNYFPARNVSGTNVTWLYESLARQWAPWIPPRSQINLREYGFYSVHRPDDNLCIISLNTNHAYLLNWWVFVSDVDPDSELQWLIGELQKAEDANEDVYIIGHIPPGGQDVAKHWSSTFYSIVQRYEQTIVGQFYGHSHKDEFEIFYSNDNRSVPVSVAYQAPAITPFTEMNPGFRVYTVDSATNRIVDHETWVMDLLESNRLREPIFFREYSAKEAYGLPDLSPAAWHNLTVRMEEDAALVDLYVQHRFKSTAAFKRKCDEKCRPQLICRLRSAKSFFPCPKSSKKRQNVSDVIGEEIEYVNALDDGLFC